MTHSEAVDWPDVSVPGTVYPAALADTYPDEATIGGPVYWAARPHHPRLVHLPVGRSAVVSLADWKRRRSASTEGPAGTA
ncbi:hypothetical protein [Micromonospora vulcania]|uniref:Uncharacterized protein n=1 Tax=Micromonospora vulcania TaxID=1441873 RepID=A0ABW1HFL3_9ACTN